VGSTIRADLAPVTGLADDLAGQLLDNMLGEASLAIKKQALHIGEKVTGGDLRLSGRKGARLSVGYKISGQRSTIDLKPVGLWALTTEGAKAHMIGAGRRTKKGTRTRGPRGRKVLKIGGQFVTAPIRHPGTRGKGSLDRVWAQVPRIVEETFGDLLEDAMP